ncbi:hybrid sensor histidine kinase/response regulator transcription factor [Flexithrix dorotheae]|uniref:hybrid sensor histidine kinase/response regulator transcription factor n=1 Tax=Flexithrix dorotheae TaxID=70993 RepID=UPI0003615EFC|nr:two-component regulator propeller domain-containing protein [Flexithrix dorotheae]
MKRLYLFICLFLIISYNGDCQENYEFIHFSQNKGLPETRINALIQDSKGFIWVGTDIGINRYDGYSFKQIDFANQKPIYNAVKSIKTIFEDSKGRIWMGGKSCGLYQYDYNTGIFSRFLESDSVGLLSNTINCITEDQNQNIWIGTTRRGLFRFDEESKSFVAYPVILEKGVFSQDILALLAGDPNRLWVGTENALYYLDLTNETFHEEFNHITHPENVLGGIVDIEQSDENYLWLGTGRGGLVKYYPQTKQSTLFTYQTGNTHSLGSNVILQLFIDSSQNLWVGTDGGGLNKLKKDESGFETILHHKYFPSSISSNSVISIMEDAQGNLWFGNNFGGINFLQKKNPEIVYHYGSTDQFPTRVLSILVDRKGDTWIGTDGSGLNFFSHAGQESKHYSRNEKDPNSISGNYIQHLLEDTRGNIWIATYNNGLSILKNDRKTFISAHEEMLKQGYDIGSDIRNILLDSQGKIWIGSDHGLFVVDENLHLIESFNYSNSQLDCEIIVEIFEDKDQNIWLGSIGGGLFLYEGNGNFKNYRKETNNPSGICSNRICTINQAPNGDLWIGSYNNGLSILNPKTQSFSYLGMEEGLPSYDIKSILFEEAGNAWISTNNGLARYNSETKIVDIINKSSGLQGVNFIKRASFKDDLGRLYFGGVHGYNIFSPENLKLDKEAPKLIFSSFKILNQTVEIGKGKPLEQSIEIAENINLEYDQSSFTFEYTSLDDLPSPSYDFAYRLFPFQKEWQYVGKERTANFTNIPPGKYSFQVMASDGIKKWTAQAHSVSIFIAKPFWATNLAYLIYFLVGITTLLLSYRYVFLWSKLKSNLALEKLSREKENEINQMKLNFFTKMSHEIRTPLTLIMGPIDQIIESTYENPKVNNYLQTIKSNAQRLVGLTNQLLDLRKKEAGKLQLKARKGDLLALLEEIILSFKELARQRDIQLVYQVSEKPEGLWFDDEKIEHVIFNLLSNAFKFTSDGGSIKISVRVKEKEGATDWVEISIKDNGIGIPENDLPHIFDMFYQTESGIIKGGSGIGLSLSHELINLHHGQIRAFSAQREGTEFIISLPLGEKHLSNEEKLFSNPNPIIKEPNLGPYKSSNSKKIIHKKQAVNDHNSLLIVEDNPEVRDYLKHIFEEEFDIEVAENGETGLKLARKILPDLIISDVMMPIMDGIEMTSILKNDIRTSHIPMILLTARSSSVFKIEGLETGAEDYITKPFEEEVLKLKVKNLLGNSKRAMKFFRREVLSTPQPVPQNAPDEKFIKDLVASIEKYMDDPNFKVERLAKDLSMSHSVLYRKCLALTGKPVSDFIRIVRLKKATLLLKEGSLSVAEVAYQIGFNDAKYFSKCFKKQFGKSPSAYLQELKNHTN